MACSNHPLECLQTVQRSTGWLLLCSLTVSCVAPEGVRNLPGFQGIFRGNRAWTIYSFPTLPCIQASNSQRPWSHRSLGIGCCRPHHHTTPCQDSSRLLSRSLGLVQRSDLGGLGGYRAALEGCRLSNGSRAVGGPGKGAELGSKGWKSAECRLIFFLLTEESAVFEANGSLGGAVLPH